MKTETNENLSRIPVSMIDFGENPRKFRDDSEYRDLLASIRELGVCQPILVRPVQDRYVIVAGERRFRAASEAFGAQYEMPCVIREMSDHKARKIALVENTVRANMSHIEEANAAARLLGEFNGDRDEVCRRISWSKSRLEQRLALLNCSQSVQQALIERKILLGHAELFAGIRREVQDRILPVLVERKLSVQDLKREIAAQSCELKSAIFDTTACASCPHNSDQQKSMFAECVDGGRCTDRNCFKQKTDDELNRRVESLKEEYPVVRLITQADRHQVIRIRADGEKGIGAERCEQCRACANFGAAISAMPESLGAVFTNTCFKPDCYTKLMAQRIAEQEPPKEVKKEKTEKTPAKTDGLPKQEAEPVITDRQPIKEYREKVWRHAMQQAIGENPKQSVCILIAICLSGKGRDIGGNVLEDTYAELSGEKVPGSITELSSTLRNLDDNAIRKLLKQLSVSAMTTIEKETLVSLARFIELDLRKFWKLDKEFLNILTKSEIDCLCKEIGLDTAVGQIYKKIMTGKKDELIDKLLAVEGFDFSAVVPRSLQF